MIFRSKTNEIDSEGNRRDSISSLNIIGQGTFITGDITCEGDIRIDGTLKGTLQSKSKVVIGATGNITGNINCNSADVSGKIEGKIDVLDILILQSTANVLGDINTQKLVVNLGALFNGKCTMNNSKLTNNQSDNNLASLAKK